MRGIPVLGALLLAPAWLELGGSGSGGGVSGSAGASLQPSLAVDASGRPWIAWEDQSTFETFLKRWTGSAWEGLGGSGSGPGLSDAPGNSQHVSLRLDSAERPVLAWSENLGLWVKRWDGSAWVGYGGSASGAGIGPGDSCFDARLRLDANDRPVVAWMYAAPTLDPNPSPPYQILLKRWTGSAWEGLGGSDNPATGLSHSGQWAENPSLALDSAGNPVVAWGHADVQGIGLQIYVKRWNGGAWVAYGNSATAEEGIGGPGSHGSHPSVALDASDNPVVAWHEYNLSSAGLGEIYVKRWNGSAWVGLGGSDTGSGISASGGTGARFPSLVLDAAGNPAVAWQQGALFTSDEVYYKRWNGSSWISSAGSASGGGVSQTAASSGYASLALTAAGEPLIAWTEGAHASTSEIFFRALGDDAAPPPPPPPPAPPSARDNPNGDRFPDCGLLGLDALAWLALVAFFRRR
jgi:hypothetical protein